MRLKTPTFTTSKVVNFDTILTQKNHFNKRKTSSC